MCVSLVPYDLVLWPLRVGLWAVVGAFPDHIPVGIQILSACQRNAIQTDGQIVGPGIYEGLDGGGGGSGIHYSLKIQPIIRLTNFLGLFIKIRPIIH